MKLKCLEDLCAALVQKHPEAKIDPAFEITFEPCPAGMNGDITVNCFRFARNFAASPDVIAQETADFLSAHAEVAAAEKVKAFVNVTLKAAALFRDSVADMEKLMADSVLPPEQTRRILVEYSAPNTNKPQHLGHVRNNILGMTLVSLLKRVGHDMVPVNLVNDRGIHICKSMIAYQRCGNGITPAEAGIKGDHFVGDYYVKFNSLFSDEVKKLKETHPEFAETDKDDLLLETEIGRAAQEMLQKWEAGDEEVVALWKKMNSWVFDGFAQTYSRMGVEFTKTYLESQTYLLGKQVVLDNVEKGIFALREDGATIVELGKVGKKDLGTKVLLRKDGTSVYITQDIGTTLLKYKDFQPQSMIWVVGNEQIDHFQKLFRILQMIGCEWADKLYHFSYGMVELPHGKMKSREGTVVDADDLFDEMFTLAKQATLDRLGEGEEAPADLDERAETIGMGALKFMLLKFNPTSTIKFNPEESLKFEGDTGPFIQYVCARINSISRKAVERGLIDEYAAVDWSLLDSPEERALAVTALRYKTALCGAAEKMDCSVLVLYLLDLAKAFNRFYREKQVLNAEDPVIRKTRLALCHAVRDILTDGLKTLTIGVPQAM